MHRLRTIIARLAMTASLSLFIVGCNESNTDSLKDAYAHDFLIGTAINYQQTLENSPGETRLFHTHFNALTPENCMKTEVLHPAWNTFDFSQADQLVSFAQKHDMVINGHTLIWHSQLPRFAQQLQSADSVRQFFESHIQTVASRYAGKLQSWDVVNEALEEDGSLRSSIFLDHLGAGYIAEAFQLTSRAAPDAELYYNDYNIEMPAKRAGCIALVKDIQSKGIRIDGVGIQGHWRLGQIPFREIEESILAFDSLGLKVMITELDIDVLPPDSSANPYAAGIPDSVLHQQAAEYEQLFRLFLRHRDKISRVSFWGLQDAKSWLNHFPFRGRTNYPLLFDRQLRPKPAFDRIMELKRE
jgi:endo-1,4-beta-xylanase